MKSLTIALTFLCLVTHLGCAGVADQTLQGSSALQAIDNPEAFYDRQAEQGWAGPERRLWRIEYRPIEHLSGRWNWHVVGTDRLEIWPSFVNRDIDKLDKTKVYEIDATAVDGAYQSMHLYVYGVRPIGETTTPIPPQPSYRESQRVDAVRNLMRIHTMQNIKGSWVDFAWPPTDRIEHERTGQGERWVVDLDDSRKPSEFPDQLVVEVKHTGGLDDNERADTKPRAVGIPEEFFSMFRHAPQANADLDHDGVDEWLIGNPASRGNAGLHFLVLQRHGEDWYVMGDLFGHAAGFRVLPLAEDGSLRLIGYHRLSGSEGTIATYTYRDGAFVVIDSETVQPGDGGTPEGRARLGELFETNGGVGTPLKLVDLVE